MSEGIGAETLRTYEGINAKIKAGDAVVLTAEEFAEYTQKYGLEKAAKEVDVVTTGTFGPMCSSGAFFNFGHAEPPIKLGGGTCLLNNVPAYAGLAAVDTYLGATAMSITQGFEYGGGHVIEDLVAGKDVELRGEAYGTDCYPRKSIETTITLADLNQAILLNPRNAYQRYSAATNSTNRILYTYMGILLPNFGNITYAGAGQLSPLSKDRNYHTIGIGTRIFLGGGAGYIVGEGTQHNPQNQFGTLMVRGDLKKMKPRYIKGATFHRYGTSLYVGLGIPIPIINLDVASTASATDDQLFTNVLDYSVPSRGRPKLKQVSYGQLKSGSVELNGKDVPTSPLSSFAYAKEVAETLKSWIKAGEFTLNRPAELLPTQREFRGLEVRKHEPKIRDIMTAEVVTAKASDDINTVAKLFITHNIDHLPIVDEKNKLQGIVTSWDVTKAVAQGKKELSDVMTKRVITTREEESIDIVARRLLQHNISGAPVVNAEGQVVGIVTTGDMTKLLRGNKR